MVNWLPLFESVIWISMILTKIFFSNRWWHKGGPYFTECWITVTKATLFSCSSWNCTVWAPQVCLYCIHDLSDCPLLCNFFQGQPTNLPHCLMVGSFRSTRRLNVRMWLSKHVLFILVFLIRVILVYLIRVVSTFHRCFLCWSTLWATSGASKCTGNNNCCCSKTRSWRSNFIAT